MAAWIRVAEEKELAQCMAVEVNGRRVAIFRLEDGVFALDDICSHEYSRLSEGEIWAGEVYCPKHGSRFDIKTGDVRGLPATQPVKTYPVRLEGGGIYLQWG